MKILLKKITSLCLTAILSLSFSLTAFADAPTQIYVGAPGTTSVTIPEESATDSVVFTLETDADPGDITFSKSDVVNAATARFDVEPNGDVTVINQHNINFENGSPSYTLPVIASEAGGATITEDIVINLEDINDAPIIDNTGNIVRYEEQEDDNTIFYTGPTIVYDEDSGDSTDDITITELSCVDNLTNDCAGIFSFDFVTIESGFGGSIIRLDITGPSFDYEDRAGVNYYDVTIEAEDLAGASNSDTIRINNTDIGETDDVVSTTADGTYGIGDEILIDVNLLDSDTLFYLNQPTEFDPDTFILTELPTTDPTLELQLDSGTADAELSILPDDTFEGGSIDLSTGEDAFFAGTGPGAPVTFLRFIYEVMEGDSAAELSYTGTDAIDMGTGLLQDGAFNEDAFGAFYFEEGPGEPVIPTDIPEPGLVGSLSFAKNIVIDGIRPFINNATGAAIETTHLTGDVIEFSLDFNEDLDLSGYDYESTVDLDIGGVIVTADDDFDVTSGLDANQIGFTYTVLAGQLDLDGIDVDADSFSGGNISDLAGNDILDLSHIAFNLPNDLVGEEEVAEPVSTSSGGGGGNNATVNNPFDEPEEEEEEVETTPEPEEEEEVETTPEPEEEEEVETIPESEEEEETTPIVVTPTPEPEEEEEVETTPEPEEEEEEVETTPEPEEEEEQEISFTGSLTTNNSQNSSKQRDVKECEEYDSTSEYSESQSYDCDPSEEHIETENAPTIQLNLPQNRQSQYNNDDFIIIGKVSDESIENVEVIAISGAKTYSLGIAKVDEAGKFLVRNRTDLPENEDILVYGIDVESPVQSPDYGLAINNNVRLIDSNLISFADKPVERLYESNDEDVDYWTFVSSNQIKNGRLSATVKTELNTEHKAFWQSVLFGSTAITGSNSDETILYAPDETLASIQPFSKHTVTILAEKSNAKSVPMVIEYYVIPSGFGAGVGVLALAMLFGAWYLYNKKKQIHSIEAENEVVASDA